VDVKFVRNGAMSKSNMQSTDELFEVPISFIYEVNCGCTVKYDQYGIPLQV